MDPDTDVAGTAARRRGELRLLHDSPVADPPTEEELVQIVEATNAVLRAEQEERDRAGELRVRGMHRAVYLRLGLLAVLALLVPVLAGWRGLSGWGALVPVSCVLLAAAVLSAVVHARTGHDRPPVRGWFGTPLLVVGALALLTTAALRSWWVPTLGILLVVLTVGAERRALDPGGFSPRWWTL
ncbi:hypothetical protein WHI96_05355 [Pseudonocardia tropica]|uniref:Uncharacterized protein n=1 Tax=Pseudonocardia tropica TaxID=681289 RepID=A0ABV1JRZ6_9PSEU